MGDICDQRDHIRKDKVSANSPNLAGGYSSNALVNRLLLASRYLLVDRPLATRNLRGRVCKPWARCSSFWALADAPVPTVSDWVSHRLYLHSYLHSGRNKRLSGHGCHLYSRLLASYWLGIAAAWGFKWLHSLTMSVMPRWSVIWRYRVCSWLYWPNCEKYR